MPVAEAVASAGVVMDPVADTVAVPVVVMVEGIEMISRFRKKPLLANCVGKGDTGQFQMSKISSS